MTAAPRRLDRRPSRSVPATVLALVLLALGVLGIWLLGSLLIDGSWPHPATSPLTAVGDLHLNSAPMASVAVALAVLGLILLLAGILPGRPAHRLVLDDDVPGSTVISQRDLGRRVRRRVERTDGVQSVRVHVTSRRVNVKVMTPLDDAEPVRHRVEQVAQETVTDLRPNAAPRIRVRMRSAR